MNPAGLRSDERGPLEPNSHRLLGGCVLLEMSKIAHRPKSLIPRLSALGFFLASNTVLMNYQLSSGAEYRSLTDLCVNLDL